LQLPCLSGCDNREKLEDAVYFGLTEHVRQFDGRSYACRAVSKRKSAKNPGLIAQMAKGQHSQTDFIGLTIYSYSLPG
jgi:hypothetical protein